MTNTREVGPVEVLERSNPGEGLTRVEFAVGPPAIDRRATVRQSSLDAAGRLGTDITDLDGAIAALQAERDDLAGNCERYRSAVLDTRLSALRTIERGGETWRVGTVADFGPNEVGEAIQTRTADGDADVIAVVGEGSAPFVVVATTDAAATDAGNVIDGITDAFGGGGGGGSTFAQGGGLDADHGAVVRTLCAGERSG